MTVVFSRTRSLFKHGGARLASGVILLVTLCLVIFLSPVFPLSPPALCVIDASLTDPRLTVLLPQDLSSTMSSYADALLREDRDHRVVPPVFRCESLELYGGDGNVGSDGSKYLCGVSQLNSPCTVYSLGSNLDFSFETVMSIATPCEIVTVDCTVDAKAAAKLLPPRTTFYHLCLGAADDDDNKRITLPSLMRLAGHTRIDVLKMDIEGSENAVAANLLKLPRSASMPFQISVETHNYNGGNEVDFFRIMTALGYVVISKDHNPVCSICMEWTLIRAFKSCGRGEV